MGMFGRYDGHSVSITGWNGKEAVVCRLKLQIALIAKYFQSDYYFDPKLSANRLPLLLLLSLH